MKTENTGLKIGTVIGIVLIVLKLFGVISLSWIWVLLPFWMPLALIAVISIIFVIVDNR